MVQRTAGLMVLASFNIVSEKGSEMQTLGFMKIDSPAVECPIGYWGCFVKLDFYKSTARPRKIDFE